MLHGIGLRSCIDMGARLGNVSWRSVVVNYAGACVTEQYAACGLHDIGHDLGDSDAELGVKALEEQVKELKRRLGTSAGGVTFLRA